MECIEYSQQSHSVYDQEDLEDRQLDFQNYPDLSSAFQKPSSSKNPKKKESCQSNSFDKEPAFSKQNSNLSSK